MYLEDRKLIEEVLREALKARADSFRLDLTRRFRARGMETIGENEEPRPDVPSVVVFKDPSYAVIYLFTEPHMNEAEFEVFRREARTFAWAHEAAAFFVRLDTGEVISESG